MARVGALPENEVSFCWEQVLRINPVFRVSHVFAPAVRARQLLPLYALFAAIEETCSSHSDESVALRKLGWWREECLQLGQQSGNHPILAELNRTGAAVALSQDRLERLFSGAANRLDLPPPADINELRQLCESLSMPLIEMELALGGNATSAARPYAAANGFAQLLRESLRQRPTEAYRWLPLTMLARHGVTRAQAALEPDRPAVRLLFQDVLSEAANWGEPLLEAASRPSHRAADHRHLHVFSEILVQSLRRLRRLPPSAYGAELVRVGPAQLYRAWRAARRFRAAECSPGPIG